MTKERAYYIDFIRIFSCLCILIVHFNASVSGYDIYGQFYYSNSLIPNWYLRAYLGDIGVSLFFMVSGASLMISNENSNFFDFYRKRFYNIYPMFWISFFVATLLSFLLFKRFPMGKLSFLLFSVLGMDGYFCTLGLIDPCFYQVGEWFLGCIILIYLIWPLIRSGFIKHPTIIWIISLLLMVYFSKKNGILFFVRIPEILFGMSVIKFKWNEKPERLLIGTVICALPTYYLFYKGILWGFIWTIVFCALLFSILLILSRIIKIKGTFLITISGLTYPVFLVHHWIISKLIIGWDLSNFPYRYTVVMFIVYFILTIAAAFILQKTGNQFSQMLKTCFQVLRSDRFAESS